LKEAVYIEEEKKKKRSHLEFLIFVLNLHTYMFGSNYLYMFARLGGKKITVELA